MKFFYNFDGDDNDAKEEPYQTCDYQDTLPEIFEDGNFELVDGLIMLSDNSSQKTLDFTRSVLPTRGSKFIAKKESKPRAA